MIDESSQRFGKGQKKQHWVNESTPVRSLIANLVLLLLLLLVTLLDVEVAELVHVGLRGDHAQPVTDLVLLQELLREVLEVLLREARRRRHNDLGAVTVHVHRLAERTSTPVHLDALVQELFLQSVVVSSR